MSLYGHTYRRVFLPLYEKLRNRHTCDLTRRAETNQWKSTEDLLAIQLRELQNILHHAYEQSPWHRERLECAGLRPGNLRTLEDFQKLPTMGKDDIREHRDQMIAQNYHDRLQRHNTGGSTGVPLQFYMVQESYEWRNAMTVRGYRWAGCADGDRQFYLGGAPIGRPRWQQRLKTKLHNSVRRYRTFNSFGLNPQTMNECIERINRFRPKTIIGYTNALCLLAQHILENKKKVFRSGALITAAEGVNDVQRHLIEQGFQAPVFASYGSREFKLIAMECDRHRGLHLSTENLLIEIVVNDRPAAPGEIGEILVTDLHNYGMPFIRYKIGDLGVLAADRCPCGRGLPLLERVEGRVLDAIRTPEGKIVPGEFFPHLMKEFDTVRQFQVIQEQLQSLRIKLVLREGDASAQLQRMEQEIKRVLGDSITINLERVPEIPLTKSGKFRVTVSQL